MDTLTWHFALPNPKPASRTRVVYRDAHRRDFSTRSMMWMTKKLCKSS